MSGALVIERIRSATTEARALVGELEAVLSASYRPESRHGLALEAIFRPHIHFLIATRDGTLAGCGGVALLDGFAELKRMYVRPSMRGQGVARALVERLSAVAAGAGNTVLRLETGDAQHAALRFYAREGFARCGAFSEYAGMPPASIATSVFMEKAL